MTTEDKYWESKSDEEKEKIRLEQSLTTQEIRDQELNIANPVRMVPCGYDDCDYVQRVVVSADFKSLKLHWNQHFYENPFDRVRFLAQKEKELLEFREKLEHEDPETQKNIRAFDAEHLPTVPVSDTQDVPTVQKKQVGREKLLAKIQKAGGLPTPETQMQTIARRIRKFFGSFSLGSGNDTIVERSYD